MINFVEIISASIEYVKVILFRPFRFKKWLVLGFIALLAGQLSGFSLPNFKDRKDNSRDKKVSVSSTGKVQDSGESGDKTDNLITELKKLPTLYIVLVVLSVILFSLIFIWLSSRFRFIFLESVVNNDASVKLPFKAHKKIGNSLFLFSLGFGAIVIFFLGLLVLGCFRALAGLGVFNKTHLMGLGQIFLTCLPFAAALFFLLVISVALGVIVYDFAVVVMLKDKIKVIPAIIKVSALFKARAGDFIKYFFIKIGLQVCTVIASGLLLLISMLVLLIPLGLAAGVFYLIYLVVPQSLRLVYFAALFTFLVPVALFSGYCLSCLYLPFAVFFRTFSLKIIGSLAPEYDLLSGEKSAKEAVVKSKNRSWVAIIVGVVILCMVMLAAFILLTAIVFPNILKERRAANDTYAQGSLQTISMALENYHLQNGKYPQYETSLVYSEIKYLDRAYNNRAISGYKFIENFTSSSYEVTATPEECGVTGTKILKIKTGGVLTSEDCRSK